MARQTTDQLYIELDYYYPEEFYVYTAEAQADLSCTSTIDCTISNVRGADLVAFSDAALTADAIVTRDVSATIAATATIDQFVGDLYALRSASLTSEFAQTVDANRLREPQIALNSEFVFDAIVNINGAVVGSGTFTATASLDITPELYKDMGANLYADAVMDPDGVQRIRAVDSTQQVEFTQDLVYTKIVQGDCAFNALFAPSMTVEAVRNAFAVLDSTSALAVVAIANRSADIALSSIVNQSLQGDRFRDYVINANSQFALSVEYVNTVPAQATLTSSATLTTNVVKLKITDASVSSAFTVNANNSRNRISSVAISSAFTQTQTLKITKTVNANLTGFFAEVVVGQPTSTVAISAIASINCTPRAIRRANISTSSNFTVLAQPNYKTKYWILDTSQPNYPRTIDSDQSGNLLATYYSTSTLNIEPIEVNKDGTVAWQKTTGFATETTNQLPNDSVVDDSGNLYVVGRHNPGGSNNSLFVKYTSAGELSFARTTGATQSYGITYANSKLYLITTNQSSINPLYFSEYSTGGSLLSASQYTSSVAYQGGKIVSDGTKFYILGSDDILNSSKIYVTCLDSSFNIVWNKNYSINADRHQYTTFKLDNSGNLFLAGQTVSAPAGDIHFLMKISCSDGSITWTKKASNTSYVIRDIDVSNDYIYVSHNYYGVLKASTSDASVVWNNYINRTYTDGGTYSLVTVDTAKDALYFAVTDGILAKVPLDGSKTGVYGTYEYLEQTNTTSFTDITGTATNFTLTKTAYSPTVSNVTLTNNNSSYTSTLTQFFEMGSATLTSAFSVSLIPGKIAANRATITSVFTETARARVSYDPTISINSNFTESATPKKIVGVTANLSSAFTATTTVRKVNRTTVTLTAQAVVNSTVRKYVGNGASLFPVITTVANNSRIRGFSSTINAMASELAAVVKTGQGIVQLDSVATQTTDAVKTAQGHLDAIVVATQVTDAYKTVRTGTSVTARATLTLIPLKIPRSSVGMESAFTSAITTNNSKITRFSADMSSTAQQSSVAVKTARTQKTLSAVATLAFGNQVTRLRLANSQQSVSALISAPAIKTARTGAELEAFDTVLATGTKISFDPVLQLTIIPENRIILILEEERLLMVPEETRVNMVRKIAI